MPGGSNRKQRIVEQRAGPPRELVGRAEPLGHQQQTGPHLVEGAGHSRAATFSDASIAA